MNQEIAAGKSRKKQQSGSRDNNFNIVRLIATIFVFAGHMALIMGGQPILFCGFSLHQLGVSILFLISGYLITKSWMSDSNPLRYAIRRFFRLWPPFAVMILLMAFVAGPLLSDLGVQGYFASWFSVYLKNLRFYIIYALPGVFTDVPMPNTVNGSLWTMPVEAALYVVTPLLVTLFRVKRRQENSFLPMAALTAAACVFDLYLRAFCADKMVVFYGTDLIAAYHLVVFYLIGTLFTYERVRSRLNLQIAGIAMCVMLVFQASSETLRCLMLYAFFPYFVFSLVFAPAPVFHGVGRKLEPSYGIYLYGFLFQQLVVFQQQKWGISLGYTGSLILSAIPTVAAAALSYYLVEQPVMRFSRFLIRKLKKDTKRIS